MAKDPDPKAAAATVEDTGPANFVKELVEEELSSGTIKRLVTRFPPEPNGYLHIGHAKAIFLNYSLSELGEDSRFNLRFDDTNPTKEEQEYVDAIKADVTWLGLDWGEREYYASDYFDQLYEMAVALIKAGKAYVDSQSPEEVRERRGNYYKPGVESPFRERSVEENLELFERMRAGEFDEGAHVLRAKIDMTSPNMNLRDPPMYRILKATHHRTGDKWCIYPTYDFAHGQSDAIEGITHSICTLEFEDHRPLYEWFIDNIPDIPARPRQIEFAKLNLSYIMLSKRRLLQLVNEGHVSGWDDPRMPTLAGMRRRGFTPEALRALCERVGVAKRDGVVDISLLEHALREDLDRRTPRVMGVLNPLKLVIENLPADEVIELDAPFHPEDAGMGSRKLQLTREVYIEREDFREEAPKKWFRFAPGKEVRLRYACLVTCTDVIKDPNTGEVTELRGRWDPESRGGQSPDGRKVRGTSHWVPAALALPAEVRLYDRLFSKENPLDVPEGGSFADNLNPESLTVLRGCRVEPSLADAPPGHLCQFERQGYFCVDSVDSKPGALVFNRTIALRDSWAKIEKKLNQK